MYAATMAAIVVLQTTPDQESPGGFREDNVLRGMKVGRDQRKCSTLNAMYRPSPAGPKQPNPGT